MLMEYVHPIFSYSVGNEVEKLSEVYECTVQYALLVVVYSGLIAVSGTQLYLPSLTCLINYIPR